MYMYMYVVCITSLLTVCVSSAALLVRLGLLGGLESCIDTMHTYMYSIYMYM